MMPEKTIDDFDLPAIMKRDLKHSMTEITISKSKSREFFETLHNNVRCKIQKSVKILAACKVSITTPQSHSVFLYSDKTCR